MMYKRTSTDFGSLLREIGETPQLFPQSGFLFLRQSVASAHPPLRPGFWAGIFDSFGKSKIKGI